MKKAFLALILLLGFSLPAQGQGNTVTLLFPGVPTGSCAFLMIAIDDSNGDLYHCDSGAWSLKSAGSGAPTSAEYLVLTLHGSLSAERNFTAGSGIGSTDGGANGAYDIFYDSSELTANQTFWSGASATRTITYSLSGATDPVFNFGNNLFNVTNANMQEGGTDLTKTVSFTDGNCAEFDASGDVVDSGGVCGAGAAHDILSATHGDTTAATVVRGDLMTGQTATPEWTRLALGGVNLYPKSDGTDIVYSTLAAGGVGACTNQFARALNADAAPTCETVVPADLDLTVAYAFSSTSNTFIGASFTDGSGAAAGAGVLRCANAVSCIAAEAAPAGTDGTVQYSASEVWILSDGMQSPVVEATGSAAGEVRLFEPDPGTNFVAWKAPATLSADVSYTVPSVDGVAGAALVTDGSTIMSFTLISSENLFTANKQFTITMVLETPTASDDALLQHKFSQAVTILRISCSTDAGTATIQLDERVEATPNTGGTDVMTSVLVCDNDTQATTAFDNAGISADAVLNLDIDAVASTPGVVRIHIDVEIVEA